LPSGYKIYRIIDGTNSVQISGGLTGITTSDVSSYTSGGNTVVGTTVKFIIVDT
jgi:hypothetical protein